MSVMDESDRRLIGVGFLLIVIMFLALLHEHGSKLVDLQKRVGTLERQK